MLVYNWKMKRHLVEKCNKKVARCSPQTRKAAKDGLGQHLCSKSTQGNKNQ